MKTIKHPLNALAKTTIRPHAGGCISLDDLAAAAGSIRPSRYRAEIAARLRKLLRDSDGDIRQEATRALARLAA